MDRKQTIKKILGDQLSRQEEQQLLATPSVEKRMKREWHEVPDFSAIDEVNPDRLLKRIYQTAITGNLTKRLFYYKMYSAVASVLLVIGIGLAIWEYQTTPPTMYIVSSGQQSTESVCLPDGTRVIIGAGSKLSYPQKFKGADRRVTLSGQAFFDVAKNPSKPFIVETRRMQVTALGTAFEVFSFDDEKIAETVLLNGKVRICPKNGGQSEHKEYILNPNERLFISDSGEVNQETVDADKYSAWRSKGRLSFENEKLSMIIPRMEKWFRRRVYCDPKVAESHRFTFTVGEESLEQLLLMIDKISPLTYESDGRTYRIKYDE